MRTRTVLATAVVAVLVAALATIVTLALADDDGSGHRGAMMSSEGGSGAMLGMHGTRVTSEYAFLAEMVVHHEEAVRAARELERSERPEMQAFGGSIVESQTAQIDQMEEWLADWYPDRSGRVEELATTIRDDQRAEIFQMQQWLRDWFGSAAPMPGWGG